MYPGQRFNAFTHLAGFVLAMLGSVFLLGDVIRHGSPRQALAALVFGLAVLLLYAASTLAHSVRGRRYTLCQRLDHCAIYLLIAGTFTPFILATTISPLGWALLTGIWLAGGWGVWREFQPQASAQPSVKLYLVMGWLGVAGVLSAAQTLTVTSASLFLAGAFCYSVGTIFYRNRRGWKHAHGLWHLFVLVGAATHFVTVGVYIL